MNAKKILVALTPLVMLLTLSCGEKVAAPAGPPPCDEKCKDGVVVKAVRETAKLAFNIALQGKPVGSHDVTGPCPFGGTVRVFGTATSNAIQGATEVNLTYVMTGCSYRFEDDDPEDNYETKLTGTLTQIGTIAVQPSATSALIMKSESMVFEGTVYDPPIEYSQTCPMDLSQNGNTVIAKICDRDTKTDL